jgi:cation:H+ antiporter
MELTTPILVILLGLALLAGGGELLVRAATTIAEIAGVSPAVIGLTVVAIGTSLPELVVSVLSSVRGEPDLAVANVVGSNIFNIAATLGLTAMIIPLPVHGTAVRLEWPVMFVASLVTLLVARDGSIDRFEGMVMLVTLAVFVAYTVRIARRDVTGGEARQIAEEVEARDIGSSASGTTRSRLPLALALLVLGVGGLVAGGNFLVDGAVRLARLAGLSERVIGLTIVAGGTGAPELATSLVAAFRKRTDVAIANMIGSNIFNLLGILGVTALVTPIPVASALVHSDMWWMVGSAIVLLPFLKTNAQISRVEGVVLAGGYVTYLVVLLRS